ncbi:MAG: diaminopimelate epimerase, partial [Acidimicrobiaceae bacterium]|nr:diaminopimelate epimerase [Acidimicrobiaceae bacterium]
PRGGVRFGKYHGIGNDFLVVLDLDGVHEFDASSAAALCDRHLGLGADGVIRGRRAPESSDAVVEFQLWNADGSSAEISGNGMRCLAQAALEAGIVVEGLPFGVLTPAGRKEVTVRWTGPGKAWASTEMGVPVVEGEADRCNVGHGQLLVDVGNPHLVVLGPDPSMVDVASLGPALEATSPGGLNVEFVALGPGPDEITMRVWERGVGETQACGTGSCAAAVALHHWGRVGNEVSVHQPGGAVAVSVRPDGRVLLAGPSARVGSMTADPWLLAPAGDVS